jgi:hypothetical protein
LDGPGDVYEGHALRRLAGLKPEIFTTLESELPLGGLEGNPAINERQPQSRLKSGNLEEKFGSPDRSRSQGGVEFDVGGFFAIEEVKRAARQTKAMLFGTARGQDFKGSAFVETNHAAVGQLNGGPTIGAAAEASPGLEAQADGGGLPIGAFSRRELDLTGGFQQDAK